MEIDILNYIKRPFSGVAKEQSSFRMLIPSISKAKRNYYGVSSSGTDDYRHGAEVRPKKKYNFEGHRL